MNRWKIEEKEKKILSIYHRFTNYLSVLLAGFFVCVVRKEEDSMIIRSPEPEVKILVFLNFGSTFLSFAKTHPIKNKQEGLKKNPKDFTGLV
jgi:hypothetical protein